MTALRWWAAGARGEALRADLVAGTTTAIMLVPQAMAYALLAGLPPVMGLYASTLPLLVYALFGRSRELAVGPVAMDSLLVAAALAPIAAEGSARSIDLAIGLALLVGLVQLGFGMLRVGALVARIPRAVFGGFTSAAAIIIGVSQLPSLLGIEVPRAAELHRQLFAIATAVPGLHVPTLILGGAAIGIVLWLRAHWPKVPRALVVVVLGVAVVRSLGLAQHGVSIVGDVPSGLPAVRLPPISGTDLVTLLPSAVLIAVVAFMEAASVAQALAARRGRSLPAGREFMALGLANVAASVVGGYPVTGGFSRTAVNADAGARSRWAGVVTAALVLITLGVFTAAFHSLPKAILAAIIMTAVGGLIDIRSPLRLWTESRVDAGLWVITFVGTVGLGIGSGLALGAGAAVLAALVRRLTPHPGRPRGDQ